MGQFLPSTQGMWPAANPRFPNPKFAVQSFRFRWGVLPGVLMATQAASPLKPRPAFRGQWFYPGMAILAAAIVVLGFARTYYLKAFFDTPSLSGLLQLHGALMTAWLALFITQSFLVETGRTDIHRKLGVSGAVLAAAIVVVGPMVAVHAARLGHAPLPGINPLAFMVVPFGDMFVFAALVGAALWLRRKVQLHKRLMLIAMISILPAGIARWPMTPASARNPLFFFGVADLLLIACAVYDWRKSGRFHQAWMWGGVLVIASQPLRIMFAGTAVWMSFAHWITGI